MGQPIRSPDIPHLTDCPRCVPPSGSRWAVGKTPQYIWATFWDINNCGLGHHSAPNGQLFRMEQSPGNSCIWTLLGSTWHVNFVADLIAPANSRLRLSDHDGWSYFTAMQPACPAEYTRYNNLQAACVLMYAGSRGHGMIWWNEELLEVASWLGLTPSERLMYEPFKAGPVFEVHRFADQRDHTNVKIKKM